MEIMTLFGKSIKMVLANPALQIAFGFFAEASKRVLQLSYPFLVRFCTILKCQRYTRQKNGNNPKASPEVQHKNAFFCRLHRQRSDGMVLRTRARLV